jgi:type IV pilus secretin PilQ/predicted competence protein
MMLITSGAGRQRRTTQEVVQMSSSRVVLLSIVIASFALGGRASAATELLGLRTAVKPGATTLFLRFRDPVQYTPNWIDSRTFTLDVIGVSSNLSHDSQAVRSPLVDSYRIINYEGVDSKPHVRLEIVLKAEASIDAKQQKPGEVAVTIQQTPAESAAPGEAVPLNPKRGTAIQAVQVAKLEGTNTLEVQIAGNGSLDYRMMQLTNPQRLVVDIPNALNRIRQKELPVNTPPLQAVRIAQLSREPLVSRVVLDLDSKSPYQVRKEANSVVVSLEQPAGASAANNSATGMLVATDQARKVGKPMLQTQTAAQAPEASPIRLAAFNVTEPRPAAPRSAPAALQAEPEASEVNDPISPLPEVAPMRNVTPQATDSSTLLAQAAAPAVTAAPQAGAATPPRPTYTGEPISVNLKDVDLKDFFRLIHEISGLNIVLDPSVSGAVTIVLDEVPWDQAMEIVMRNNGLGKEVEGNVVRIAKLSTLEAEEKQRQALTVATQAAQPTVTTTRTLSYAKAADLVPTIKRFLTPRGDVIPDVRTNTLIIMDLPGVIPQVDRLIRSLDVKSLQVEIEARVVSASRSFARDIGTQLAASGLTGNVTLGGTGLVGTSPINRGITPPLFIGSPSSGTGFANLAQPFATNFPAQGATSGFSFLLTGGSTFALDAIITAAESRGVGKLLSRPKIITQNNVEATVKQGVRIPIQTTINNTVSVQYIDVVLRLTVTPQITAEGTIFLKTDIENTSIDPGIATTPGQFGLDTQSANTSVLVTNGGTVFFGGVVQNINRVSEQQVPLLGSVPLVGNLFKRKQTTSTTNELLFFITPKIVQS